MNCDRRQILSFLTSSALLAAAAGCTRSPSGQGYVLGGGAGSGDVAVLLPQTGRFGAIGDQMSRAIRLAVRSDDDVLELAVHDTSGDASAAARNARGANIILGPLLGRELAVVREAVGPDTPIVSFSNDASAAGPNTLVMGIGPEQTITPILRYAGGQGVRRVALLARPGPLGARAAEITDASTKDLGLSSAGRLFRSVGDDGRLLLGALRDTAGGRLPDAVLIPHGGRTLTDFARALSGSGVQLLGTSQWGGQGLSEEPALSGAWFSAPDPRGAADFSRAFAQSVGAAPGILAALAYDAVEMARTLVEKDRLNLRGLLRPEGFSGVAGRFRFASDGTCRRDLAILVVDGSGTRVVQSATSA